MNTNTDIEPHPNGLTKVYFQMVGLDGNAGAIMGGWRRAARRQGFNGGWIKSITDEAMSGDYGHLIETFINHSNIFEED